MGYEHTIISLSIISCFLVMKQVFVKKILKFYGVTLIFFSRKSNLYRSYFFLQYNSDKTCLNI